MSKYSKLSILEIHEKLVKREITVLDLVTDTFEAIRESSNLNAFITLNEEAALEEAAHLTDIDEDDLLYGIPIAVKDNICTKRASYDLCFSYVRFLCANLRCDCRRTN